MSWLHELTKAETCAHGTDRNEMNSLGMHLVLDGINGCPSDVDKLCEVFFSLDALTVRSIDCQSDPRHIPFFYSFRKGVRKRAAVNVCRQFNR
ncbi:hypothetical protein HFRIS_000760 [Herbaspirillum frisingense GSF30]|uniref:Uncharacterized protein n=1 Tax=Herbaspirillum frisingense GSF30 TaxID=864073 RepID=A0AAI9IIQ7_9BURK|nr:hypothetical protein HFRIS_000760 [Herbaspirillum frisingense GSF30]